MESDITYEVTKNWCREISPNQARLRETTGKKELQNIKRAIIPACPITLSKTTLISYPIKNYVITLSIVFEGVDGIVLNTFSFCDFQMHQIAL